MGSSEKITLKVVRSLTPARKKPLAEYKIPLIIHQSHKSYKLPARLADNIQKWSEMNPEFEHRYYDDEAMLDYIQQRGDERFQRAFHKLADVWPHAYGAFQADLFRYLLLKNEGGVWVDADGEALKPLTSILRPDDQYLTTADLWIEDGRSIKNELIQSIIFTIPEHPFMRTCLSNAVAATLELKPPIYKPGKLYSTVGPTMLYKSVKQLVKLDKKILEQRSTSFEFEGTTFSYRMADIRSVFHAKYAGYKDDMRAFGIPHWLHLPANRGKLPLKVRLNSQAVKYMNRFPRVKFFIFRVWSRFSDWD